MARAAPPETSGAMMAKSSTSIEVEIYGSTYHVRGEQDRLHLERLAAMVDGKMREIGSRVATVDTDKIAILAALNLADELIRCSDEQEGERAQIMEKVAELAGELTDALTPPDAADDAATPASDTER